MKEAYENAAIETVRFDDADVILTSNETPILPDPGDDDE